MRRLALIWALVLIAPGLTGCLGSDEDLGETGAAGAGGLQLDRVPPGATLERTDDGLKLVWEELELPLDQEIEIPEGTTMVRITAELGQDQLPFVHLSNADTERRRCNVPYFQDGWFELTTGTMSCAGLAVVDQLPANWTATVSAPPTTDPVTGETEHPVADLVTVELIDRPLDGIAAEVDLANLSMPTHDLQEPEQVTIESFDGTELYAEVTVPEGQGPWPVIISSSPYNGPAHSQGQPSMWEYFVQDWAQRGYAVVSADVRGTGRSAGCMEVWGPNEQQDQKVLVDWAAEQGWSDGNVGFYGQSYVGTTPVEAAVQTPEALKAIIAVAPVINAYDDWHFGGVPNGENALSPAAYQATTGGTSDLETQDPLQGAIQAANGLCDPTLAARANDPRAVYDGFYEVRNFSQRAENVEAAVLYTHGFEDVNVKSAMAVPFFNDVDAPKLGLLGHWVHQHPVRADQELMFLAWMDHHVKGKDMGLSDLPAADIVVGDGTHRTAEAWPPEDPNHTNLYPDLAAGELAREPTDGSATILLDSSGLWTGTTGGGDLVLETEVIRPIHLAGTASLDLVAELQGTGNAHVAAFLYDEGPDGTDLVTFGMANLAHRNGHDSYEPVAPGETVEMGLPFLPTERVLEPGHTLRLVLRATHSDDWAGLADAGPVGVGGAEPGPAGFLTVQAGQDGTELRLPQAPAQGIQALPMTAST